MDGGPLVVRILNLLAVYIYIYEMCFLMFCVVWLFDPRRVSSFVEGFCTVAILSPV